MTPGRRRRNAIALVLGIGAGLALGIGAGLALGMAAREARAADTVQSLLANPERLATVQRGCKTNQPWATDALCRTAAEAIRRRFRGQGVPYTPRGVDPFPTRPQPAQAKPTPKQPNATNAAPGSTL